MVTPGSGFDSRPRTSPFGERHTYRETPTPTAAYRDPNYHPMSENDMTAAEYSEEIDSMAAIILDETIEYADAEIGSDSFEEELDREIWETADSHSWMIYTGYHMDVLRHADNEPTEWYNFVDLGETPGYRDVIQAMAFDVFYADLYGATFDKLRELREAE
ncbi:hypothetical protein M1M38_gp094 [Halorubrum tailed virus 27]|uniref:Uncharacterized protein n=1 Tax=Halorubrum tailed virus 27 TaxID=2878008 RepID=A0AAE8XY20_9CAUD|nr:hypothetical protein M1M38_gp094 [Halorubrum tailed virus 27]UBF22787.1 hypothetical protein HRTV-27_gp94 [Halorubrum tailed virus 27]